MNHAVPLQPTPPALVVRPHHVITPHICGKITHHAYFPVWYFESRGVGPRLETKLLLDCTSKTLRPPVPRVGRRRSFDQVRVDEVCTAKCLCVLGSCKRKETEGLHADIVQDRSQLQNLSHHCDISSLRVESVYIKQHAGYVLTFTKMS